MSDNYSHLIEENANLKRALAQSKQIIQKTSNDYTTLQQIHEDYKQQGQRMRKENEDLNMKNINLQNDKRELENQFDSTIRNLKIAIEQKQREIEEIQAKVIPSFDHDMLRIKIINELELPHKQQLDQKQEEVERAQEQTYEYKRQIEILNSKIELINKEHDRQIKVLKDRHSLEVNEHIREIQELSNKIDDNKDRELIRKCKRDAEEAKLRANAKEIEAEELRKERDQFRDEKNENLIKFSKQLEYERNDKRLYKSESEKVSIRVRFLEEEVKKNKIRMDSYNNEVEIAQREKDNMNDEIRKKDDMIHQLQRRIAEVEEEHVQSEGRNHEHSMKVYNEEHEKFLDERNKNIGLSREFEQLRKHFDEMTEENKGLRAKINKDLSSLRNENMSLQEDNKKMQRQITTMTKDNEELEKTQDKKEKYLNEQERELENLRRKYRENLQKIQTLEAQNDELSVQARGNNRNTVNNFGTAAGNQNAEVERLQRQNEKLKAKLKEANAKIVELLQKRIDKNATLNTTQQQQNTTQQVSFQQNYGENDDDIMRKIDTMYGHKF